MIPPCPKCGSEAVLGIPTQFPRILRAACCGLWLSFDTAGSPLAVSDEKRASIIRDWLVDVIGEIEFRDWRFMVGARDDAPGQFHLVIEFEEACIVTGEIATQRSRKWLLSEHMTRSEIIQTAWLAVQTALMHEARESFKWRGELIFGPHFDVEALHELCVRKATDVRPPLPVSPSPNLPVSGSASPA